MRPRLRAASLALVLAAAGVACGGDAAPAAETGPGAAAVEVGGEEGTVRAPAAAGDGREATGAVTPVETIEIEALGEVDVRVVAGRRMELVAVREAAGWSHRVDEVEHDEIEFSFRHRDGRGVKVELELEQGAVAVATG